MGFLPPTVCTGLLAFAVLTPAAHAADGGGVAVSPSTPAPGSDVTLRVSGCTETTARAVSAAFVTDVRLTRTDGALVGESRVRSTITAGVHTVKVTCGPTERTAALTVVGRAPSRPSEVAGHPAAPASPIAPVLAGGGGASGLAAGDERAGTTGPGAGHAVTGLLTGIAAAAVVLLGSRRSRGTD
jgi:hypothetical protein